MKHYDYLIVGSGLFGAVFAHEAAKAGKSCLVLEKRDHTGGNVHCETVEDIVVHQYGAHIFHTNNKQVWDYVNELAEFNRYTNSPLANYKGELYNMPFNMNTFHAMWGVRTPAEAQAMIDKQRAEIVGEPKNLEEQAIRLVGRDIYEKLVKGYTEKQWGRDCTELPAFIIKRLPVRLTYDNNYFNDRYQGIPIGGYNVIIDKLLEKADVITGVDFLSDPDKYRAMADTVVYTGTIDSYFGFCFGKLEYRTVRFESEVLDEPNYQGVAVMNYTDRETPYTRVIEHKHFAFGTQPKTVVTREYSTAWQDGMEPYYPVNDERNGALYAKYQALAANEKNTLFGGRLAEYRYYDMDKVIESALALTATLF
ncbi:MAG: UDP-galactopyranose mutase [Clostridia bacterium]|nr:UDP-galactopyranose mutase [Clostridia bacterium]